MAGDEQSDKAERLVAWMNRQECALPRAKHFFWGVLARCQRDLSFKVGSVRDLLVAALQLLLFVASTCFPIWIKFVDSQVMNWWFAILASLALVAIAISRMMLTTMRAKRASRDRAFRLAVQFSSRLARLWPAFKSLPDESKAALFMQVEAMLALILDEAKVYLGEGVESDLGANLWLFTERHERMKLAASTDSRAHISIKSTHLVAYHVAKAGIEYALNDYHQLRKAKIASHKAKFRSVFFMSLEVLPPAVENHCSLGVVTLTTSKPFRFWPSRSYGSLRAALAPHLSLLTLFLVNQHANESLPIDHPAAE